MKCCLFLLPLSFAASVGYSQPEKLFIYGEAGLGIGNYISAKLGLNCIYNSYCFGLCYYTQDGSATNVPSDYQGSRDQFALFDPNEILNTFCVTGGKVLYCKTNKVRFLLKGGLAVSKALVPTDYVKLQSYPPYNYGANYTYDYKNMFVPGILINPSVEFPFATVFGMTTGIWCHINTTGTSFGFEFNLVAGKLRYSTLHKRHRY